MTTCYNESMKHFLTVGKEDYNGKQKGKSKKLGDLKTFNKYNHPFLTSISLQMSHL